MGRDEDLKQLHALLVEKSVKKGDFVLASGRRSSYYVDARLTTMSGYGQVLMPGGNHVMLMGLTTQPVPFPGLQLALLGRTIHPGQQGGLHIMRDIPRYVKLIEAGKIDARSMITKRYTLDQGRDAVRDTADRTIITGVIEFA